MNQDPFQDLIDFMSNHSVPRINYDNIIELIKIIGEGGQASIIKAKYYVNGEEVLVAIKALEKFDLKHFKREVYILNQLNEPCFPKFYGLVIESKPNNSGISIVTEFINGVDLRNIDFIEKLKYPTKIKILRDAAKSLCIIHEKGYIHRDLNPGNMIIDNDYQVYLIDFGISLITLDDDHVFTFKRGTLPYSPPEAFMSDDNGDLIRITNKVDVWGFGCIISYVLSGIVPWTNEYEFDKNFESKLMNSLTTNEPFPVPENIKDEKILNLLNKTLVYNYEDRITMREIFDYLSELAQGI